MRAQLFCAAYYNPRIPQVIEMLVRSAPEAASAGQTRDWGIGVPQLHLRPVPTKHRGGTFGACFTSMLRELGVQAIGLSRSRNDENGQPVEYVFTKPAVSIELQENDYIFALGQVEDAAQTDFSLLQSRRSFSNTVREATAAAREQKARDSKVQVLAD